MLLNSIAGTGYLPCRGGALRQKLGVIPVCTIRPCPPYECLLSLLCRPRKLMRMGVLSNSKAPRN